MIFIFLPAYNEEAALEKLVKKFDTELKKSGEDYRVVVLDDGSKDKTAQIAETLSHQYPLDLLRHPVNLGLGQTMIDGLRRCSMAASPSDWIVTLDCDDTHEPQYLQSALNKIREGYDLIILSRYTQGGGEEGLSLLKKILSRGAGIFLSLFFPIAGVREYSCGYRVFRASALQKAFQIFGEKFIRLPQWGFVVTAEVLIKFRMMGCRIAETPFVLRYQQKMGESKNRPLKTIAGYFALVFIYWGRRAVK